MRASFAALFLIVGCQCGSTYVDARASLREARFADGGGETVLLLELFDVPAGCSADLPDGGVVFTASKLGSRPGGALDQLTGWDTSEGQRCEIVSRRHGQCVASTDLRVTVKRSGDDSFVEYASPSDGRGSVRVRECP